MSDYKDPQTVNINNINAPTFSGTSPIMRYFNYSHLSSTQKKISSWFYALAWDLENTLPVGPEKSVALRKLLEAKDAAVRSSLEIQPMAPTDTPTI